VDWAYGEDAEIRGLVRRYADVCRGHGNLALVVVLREDGRDSMPLAPGLYIGGPSGRERLVPRRAGELTAMSTKADFYVGRSHDPELAWLPAIELGGSYMATSAGSSRKSPSGTAVPLSRSTCQNFQPAHVLRPVAILAGSSGSR
jgi:hypothetical protein